MKGDDGRDGTGALAARIEDCLREADALGLSQVGIQLDMALVALRGTGLHPPDDAPSSRRGG